MINELDDSRNSIHYSNSPNKSFESPQRAKFASKQKSSCRTPQQDASDRDIDAFFTPKSYNLNLNELENAIKNYPLNLEIVKITKNIHGLNEDKLLFIEISPEEETYFTAGYCTLLQWSTKSLTIIKDYSEILFFELRQIKITKSGEFLFLGQDWDVEK